MALALLVEHCDVAYVQPLATELTGEPLGLGIFDHATHLGGEYSRVMERTGGGDRPQFGVGRRGPEEETETRGELPVIDRRGFLAGHGFLATIQESRRDQHAGD